MSPCPRQRSVVVAAHPGWRGQAVQRLVGAWLALMSLLLVPTATLAQGADPFARWRTAETPHFRIHYRAEERAQAETVARIAEKVYPRITGSLQWEPRGRTEVVVSSEIDLSNGHSTPLPYNAMTLYLAPPDSGELLDNSAWLDLLITHEFVHVVHLDKVRGAPKVLQSIFGRVPWFFPNLFEPLWVMEGLAVLHEGDVAAGKGRLQGPMFEAWLRTERERGFLSLAEINSDGRALPLSKNYLYGSYFFDFMQRRYGVTAPQQFVERYSGNIVPRFHTNPRELTGKTMDELWSEFLTDLTRRVDERSAVLKAQPEMAGSRLQIADLRSGPLLDVSSLASLPGGAVLAVVDDGLGPNRLVRIEADGRQKVLTRLRPTARVDASASGQVLVAQPDLCNSHYLVYDLFRLDTDGSLHQLTSCQRLRRAVSAGSQIAALQQDAGRTRLVLLDALGQRVRTLYAPSSDIDLIDLAATPDGRGVTVVARAQGDWRLLRFDLSAAPGTAAAAPQLLARLDAPVHSLRHTAAGLEFIAARDGVYNVWRLTPGAAGGAGSTSPQMQRLTHSYSAVHAQAGSSADGSLTVAVLAPGGMELRKLASTSVLQTATLPTSAGTAMAPDRFADQGTAASPGTATGDAPTGGATAGNNALGPGSTYWALRSLAPRSWLPFIAANDRGLSYYGASTFGADALGVHSYAATLAWETSQGEALGSIEYLWNSSQLLAVTRTLTPRAWVGDKGQETTTTYDRGTQAQWLGLLPWVTLDRRILVGLGAALDRVDRVQLGNLSTPSTTTRLRDEKIAAAVFDIDTRGANWWSEGSNRGQHTTLLFESYKPFAKSGSTDRDGSVLRLDLRGYLGIGRGVLALRHTEVRAHGRTERFQLGGATDPQLQLGLMLNRRDIALRGYEGNETALQGANARVSTLEWRMPLGDLDRHAMVPPVGLNRVSLNLFTDVGGAWDVGSRPASTFKGVGAELLGEIKLLYTLGLQLRLGVAQGLDDPKGTQAYLQLGRAF
ncbi:MAG: hypothetical protein RL375_835 [Pseudomonadota bacterium]